jgi:hypothetical protein
MLQQIFYPCIHVCHRHIQALYTQEISEANIAGICFYMQMSMTLDVADRHLFNMGKMIEEMEGKLRNSLDQVTVLH